MRNWVIWLGIIASTTLCDGCRRNPLSLDNRPCDELTNCSTGYVCSPFTHICVRPVATQCTDSACPTSGAVCAQPGVFSPCNGEDTGCDRGCRMCQLNNRWSECRPAQCTALGTTAHCSACGDDCGATVSGTDVPTCKTTNGAVACDYDGPCQSGYADGDRLRSNGCECKRECDNRCGGSDGCGGQCDDLCEAPYVCGGSDASYSCVCVPNCSNRCGGDDGCGDTCPDNCVKPATCGGGGVANECSCIPQTTQDLCTSLGYSCGSAVVVDKCGTTRVIACGTCGTGTVCGNTYVGRPGVCAQCKKRVVTITPDDFLPSGVSLAINIDHASLVTNHASYADGHDVRMYWLNGFDEWAEIDRVVDPESAWNRADTKIWFKTQQQIGGGGSNARHVLFYGNAAASTSPNSNEANVFAFADFFAREDSTVLGNDWNEANAEVAAGSCKNDPTAISTDVAIVNGGLEFTRTCGANFRPIVTRSFAKLAAPIELRIGVNWAGGNGNYVAFMQLGNSVSLAVPDTGSTAPKTDGNANSGVAVNLGWGTIHQEDPATDYYRRLSWRRTLDDFRADDPELSGLQHVTVNTHTVIATGASTGTYSIYVKDVYAGATCANESGANTELYLPNSLCPTASADTTPTYYAASASTELDTLRFMTWGIDESVVGTRRIEYVIVRQRFAYDPQDYMTLGSPVSAPCP